MDAEPMDTEGWLCKAILYKGLEYLEPGGNMMGGTTELLLLAFKDLWSLEKIEHWKINYYDSNPIHFVRSHATLELPSFIAEYCWHMGFPGGSDGKESACNAGDPGLIPGSGRSPGEGNGNPTQYSCQENSMDRGAWQAAAQGVTKSQTWLSN